MATQYISDDIGSLEDSVRLQLNGDDIVIAESWDVAESVFAQPATWAMQLGSSSVARELIQKYPKRTPFRLLVGGAVQMTGTLDAVSAGQSVGGPTLVKFRGRDALAPLHDSFVRAEQSFSDSTYADLVRRALKECGLNPDALRASNAANRKAKAGVVVTQSQEISHLTVEEILSSFDKPGTVTLGATTIREQQSKANETWHEFVRRHIDRAGLFLWAAADGTFILSQPDGAQAPTYRLVRPAEGSNGGSNVLSMEFDDDSTHRHSEAIIYGKGGGRKHGRAKSKGGFVDKEMTAAGYDQAVVFRDVNVQNGSEAAFFAQRKLAEERRSGWRLEYVIAGHTLAAISGNGSDRAVVVPDTTVEVIDDEIGINGVFYIEAVRRQRSPQTTTSIRLMRLTDLIFGQTEE